MDSSLRLFIKQYVYIVIATLVPVILIAFLSIPVSLGGHAGEMYAAHPPMTQHMT